MRNYGDMYDSLYMFQSQEDEGKLRVREWVEPGRTRSVWVSLQPDTDLISLTDRKKLALRSLSLARVDKVTIEVTRDAEDER